MVKMKIRRANAPAVYSKVSENAYDIQICVGYVVSPAGMLNNGPRETHFPIS